MNDTHQKPPHGWTCLHRSETFTTTGAARDHFGFNPSSEPGWQAIATQHDRTQG